jgi:hypothetical protein
MRGVISTAEEFVRLRLSSDPVEYGRAAHDSAPVQVWREVIAQYPEMRVWVAHNTTVPVEILRVLTGDLDANVRAMVADKRKLPEELQLRLANDSDSGVRGRLVYNARATRAVLQILASDSWSVVAEHARGRLAMDQAR